ncbi:hypothetical protein ABZX30_28345 [Streptomyces sp. NPDC004542]|uniref:hypothetical protein n=1 Tax=Streptomyces sp. NPDC004542 TaxID=3154281 RepID=UPI0033B66277
MAGGTGTDPRAPQPPPERAEGCLVIAVRIPLRIVALVLVVPVRMAWDALAAAGRFLWRYGLAPVGRAAGRLLYALVVVPLGRLYRYLLTPLGHALAWVYARVLTPAGHAVLWVLRPVVRVLGLLAAGVGTVLYWTARVLLVLPALALWRRVLVPAGRVLAVVGREAGAALGHAWRVAGHVSRAVGRGLGTLLRWILVEPARRVYRTVLTPVGHVVRDLLLRPAAEAARAAGRAVRQTLDTARETVRQARADVRRMLFGEPRRPGPGDRREPTAPAARTLGGSTTALTKD